MVSKTLKLPLNISIGLLAFVLCFVALPQKAAASPLVAQYDDSTQASNSGGTYSARRFYFTPNVGGSVVSVTIHPWWPSQAGSYQIGLYVNQWNGSATTTLASDCVSIGNSSSYDGLWTFSLTFTLVAGEPTEIGMRDGAVCGGNLKNDSGYGAATNQGIGIMEYAQTGYTSDTPPPYAMFFEMDTTSSYTSGSGTVGFTTPPPPNNATRIDSTSPENNIVATTTTLGFVGYINSSDYQVGDYVHVDLYNPLVAVSSPNAIDACNIFGAGRCSMDFPATTSGAIASSTTVTFNYGGTTKATWTIRAPNFFNSIPFIGGLFQPTVLATFSTSFVVGYQTPADYNLNGNGTATTTPLNAAAYLTDNVVNATTTAACANILNGSTTQCLASLVFPDPQTAANDFSSLYNNALQRAPIGYATRFITILSGNAGAVEPPPLTYTFGSSSPAVLQGDTVSFQIWDNMGSTSPLLLARSDDGQNKDIWDIFDPYFTILIELVVLLACLSDLFGFELRFDGTQEMQEKNMRDTARDRTNVVAARAIDRERAQRNTRNHSKGY